MMVKIEKAMSRSVFCAISYIDGLRKCTGKFTGESVQF